VRGLGSGRDHDAAYVEFVTARQDRLLRIAYAVCGDANRAEDVLQEALVKLYLAWPRMRKEGSEEAYARRIIVRADLDDRRRPWRRRRVLMADGDLERQPARSELPTEERSALFDALQELPPMQRRTVVLRHWLGLSIEETAAELGVSIGTVKGHSSRGVAALRGLLAGQQVDC
jgi:RNA polymerase sigma-70 factor (sigma-E family)